MRWCAGWQWRRQPSCPRRRPPEQNPRPSRSLAESPLAESPLPASPPPAARDREARLRTGADLAAEPASGPLVPASGALPAPGALPATDALPAPDAVAPAPPCLQARTAQRPVRARAARPACVTARRARRSRPSALLVAASGRIGNPGRPALTHWPGHQLTLCSVARSRACGRSLPSGSRAQPASSGRSAPRGSCSYALSGAVLAMLALPASRHVAITCPCAASRLSGRGASAGLSLRGHDPGQAGAVSIPVHPAEQPDHRNQARWPPRRQHFSAQRPLSQPRHHCG